MLVNAPIHVACTILKNSTALAADIETSSAFFNAQEAMLIRYAVDFVGCPQLCTLMQVDNTTDVGFSNNTIKQERSKSICVHSCWLRDRESQGQFNIFWNLGAHTMGDYFTKLFSPAHAFQK